MSCLPVALDTSLGTHLCASVPQRAGWGAQTCLSAPSPTRTRWSKKHSMVCDVSVSTTMIAGSSAAGPTPTPTRLRSRPGEHRTAAPLFLAHPPVCAGPPTLLSAAAAASVIRKPQRAARGGRRRARSAKAVWGSDARHESGLCACVCSRSTDFSRRQALTRRAACAPAQVRGIGAPGA